MAGSEELEALLVVQEHDTTLRQLRHRRDTLEERTTLAEAEAELARLDEQVADVDTRREELVRNQRRYEDETEANVAKAAQVEQTLYSGSVANPRELEALQSELASLKRRRSDLEDHILDLMEAIEPLTSQLDEVRQRRDAVAASVDGLRTTLAEREGGLEEEIAVVEKQRAEAAAVVPPALLDRYERLVAKGGGVAAARLEGSRCMACRLTLPATEVDRIRREPPDALVTCDQCGAILVR